jgi:putative ABC transport system permease protein
VAIGFLDVEVSELMLIPALILLAIICGFFPALSAYRTDVAKSLGV